MDGFAKRERFDGDARRAVREIRGALIDIEPVPTEGQIAPFADLGVGEGIGRVMHLAAEHPAAQQGEEVVAFGQEELERSWGRFLRNALLRPHVTCGLAEAFALAVNFGSGGGIHGRGLVGEPEQGAGDEDSGQPIAVEGEKPDPGLTRCGSYVRSDIEFEEVGDPWESGNADGAD